MFYLIPPAAVKMQENDARVVKAAIGSEIEREMGRCEGDRDRRETRRGEACRSFQSGKMKAE